MSHADELSSLPAVYAAALRMETAGWSHDDMSTALGIPPHAVPLLLQVAHAKLAELGVGDPDSTPEE